MFLFLGHVAEPETVLAACDVVVKPTREENPWGRDILEGLGAGKPVISIGRYDTFVETDATGFLMPDYDAGKLADVLLRLDADRALVA
ncbi:MAG: glycosyltransferase family 4 protein, partial [Tabrizicola sp.]|nr:glycosyltransferase family 4 protein [Tabrizicola sp.]